MYSSLAVDESSFYMIGFSRKNQLKKKKKKKKKKNFTPGLFFSTVEK